MKELDLNDIGKKITSEVCVFLNSLVKMEFTPVSKDIKKSEFMNFVLSITSHVSATMFCSVALMITSPDYNHMELFDEFMTSIKERSEMMLKENMNNKEILKAMETKAAEEILSAWKSYIRNKNEQ
jgi:hypothetical protein